MTHPVKKTRDEWTRFLTEELITRKEYDLETLNLPGTDVGTRILPGIADMESVNATRALHAKWANDRLAKESE
jgi:hypothetical protein